jgi:hypothetical protein
MFRNLFKKSWDLMNRRVSQAHYLLLGLVMVTGLVLAYAATVPGIRADAAHRGSHDPNGVQMKEATEQVILQWMKERSEMPEHVLSNIYRVAMNSVNADLVLAICLVESNFNPHVESEKGAIGLMGIMPGVWLEELRTKGIVNRRDDLYAISGNINSGVYVLGTYLARTNNLKEALSRYAGGDPEYAKKVLRLFGEISRTRHSEDQARLVATEAGG